MPMFRQYWEEDACDWEFVKAPCRSAKRQNPNTRDAPNLKLDWLFIQVLHDGIRPIVGAKLLKDFFQMTVDGPGADPKEVGDFLVLLAFT